MIRRNCMHEKRFAGEIDRLRSPERVELLKVEQVTGLCLEGKKIENVLDVGTGSALFAESFSKHGLAIGGVDANPEMVEVARQFVPEGDFREGTAEDLPYQEASFDLVFLGVVLHESDDPLKALKEARRVSRQRVAILEWPYRDTTFGPPLAHRLKPEDLADGFREAGFREWMSIDLSDTILYRLEV
jgi:ubiquinone/menaquinone biosynthesis C-methylase UbiE